MSLNTKLYSERLNAYKVARKDGRIRDIKKGILDNFFHNPSYFEVEINGEPRDVHIISTSGGLKKLLCKPGDYEFIKTGDYVLWKGQHYLCVGIDVDNTVQSVGSIELCNNILTWQDENYAIHTTPCVLGDKTSVYSDGLEKVRYIVLADDQIMITVPDNELIRKLSRNKRFIFNHNKESIFELTRIDNLTQKGLVTFIMKRSQYDANCDNLELNIADYQEIVDPDPPIGNIKIIIVGSDRLMCSLSEIYTATIYDDDEAIDGEVFFTISDTSLAKIVTQGNNQCEVKANDKLKLGNVVLTATLEGEETIGEKIIKIVGL